MNKNKYPTKINAKRRSQIVEATIAALSEVGYQAASFAEIGRRVGISKSVVGYHFRTKEALIDAVVNAVYDKGFQVVRPAIDAQPTFGGQIEAFIRSSIYFYNEYPSYVVALSTLRLHLTNAGKPNSVAVARLHRELTDVATIFHEGQANGEFRVFDVAVMARTLRQALDGVLIELTHHPGIDTNHYAGELVALFKRAIEKKEIYI